MRNINGHFTIVNEPGTAKALATNLLQSFESLRSPEHIVISSYSIELAAQRAQGTKATAIEIELSKTQEELGLIAPPKQRVSHASIDKSHRIVLEATNTAERSSTDKNWKKLDKAKQTLEKELQKHGFETYTQYVDYLNGQDENSEKRRELLLKVEDLSHQYNKIKSANKDISKLGPSQIITVIADILSRCPHTKVGPLPIVIDDALKDLEVGTKLRALDLLKAHGNQYPIWYVTDDPVVLSWAGFLDSATFISREKSSKPFDIDSELAS